MTRTYDPISLEILWSRLVAIVDEAAATLVRTSFSTIVSEANDYACVLLDPQGRSIAQSSLSPGSFIGTLPVTVRAFLEKHPVETLRPGDVLVTNDPWVGTGHLNDINIAVPVFHQGKVVALSATVAHAADIGGRLTMPDNRSIYEEGLFIPILKLHEEGRMNETAYEFIRHNVRVPDEVIGDLEAQILSNRVAVTRLTELLTEYGIEDVSDLAQAIHAHSEAATRAAIRSLPAGSYSYEMTVDGFGQDCLLALTVTLDPAAERISCDYTGTSPQINAAYNVVLNYTYAYTAFALKCLLAPHVPNNEGCFKPISVTAPLGSLLNAKYPAAVGCRGPIGHYLPSVVFAALAPVLPERVRAGSSLSFWAVTLSGTRANDRPFTTTFFMSGGIGAARSHDGLDVVTFPSNLANTPVEILEQNFPLRFKRRAMVDGSGGAGRWRGGNGQEVELEITGESPVRVSFMPSRIRHAAFGLFGGEPGAVGAAYLNDGWIDPNFEHALNPGDRLRVVSPGAGGYGEPDRLP